jgi:hypothetical protein
MFCALGSAEPLQYSVKYTVPDREGVQNLSHDNRNVVLPAVVIGQLNQMLRNGIEICPESTDSQDHIVVLDHV